MGRIVLGAGAAVWTVGGVVALAIGVVGLGWLVATLPPLAIDDEALGAALVAIGVALFIAAGAHIVTLAAIRRQARPARSIAVLLCGTALATFVALAAAAFASAAARPELAIPLVVAGIGALLVGLAYAVATLAFVREIRSGSAA